MKSGMNSVLFICKKRMQGLNYSYICFIRKGLFMNLCMMSMMMAGKFTPAEIIQTTLDCGMSAIDWVTTHDTPAAELRKRCDDAGLPVAAHTPLLRGFIEESADALDEFKRSVDDTVALGAPVMMIPPFAHKRVMTPEEDRRLWIEQYRQMIPITKQAGITLTFESTALDRSPIVTADEALEVLNAVPELRLTFDNGNVATAENDAESYRKVRDRVVHVHFKDWIITDEPVPGSDRKRDGRYYTFALIGKGGIDFAATWKAIRESGYQGYVNLETSDPEMPVRDALKLVCDHLRDW